MTALYIEPDKIEEFVLFEEDFPHWNNIIKSGISLCLNISEEKLGAKILDESDPLYIAYNSSGTMELPVPLDNYIQAVKNDLSKTIESPNGIFILDIDNDSALDIQNKFGMAVYSLENVPHDLFSNTFFTELDKGSIVQNGWKGIISFKRPLSNSLIITDNFLFANEDNHTNRGLSNIVPLLDAYLPNDIEIEYQITVIAQNIRENSNEWWAKKFGKLASEIKLLRDYPINIELVLAKSEIHKRRIISNYGIIKADKGFSVFFSNKLDKVKEDNDFEHVEIFSNLDNTGTKHFQSALKLLTQLTDHCKGVSEYVAVKKNTVDRSIYGCDKNKTIKNRLLN
jgi:hypothetical protein